MYLILFHITKIKIKSISFTNPSNFDCRMKITNNPPYNVLNIIWSNVIGHFSKLFLIAQNRVNNTTAIFEMKSTIEIQNTPHSGIGKYLTLTV